MVSNVTRRAAADSVVAASASMRATEDPSRLMTLNEVSDLLGIPVATLYRWRHRGEGPPGYRIGRHVRFRRAAVEAWIESRADTPNTFGDRHEWVHREAGERTLAGPLPRTGWPRAFENVRSTRRCRSLAGRRCFRDCPRGMD